MATVTTEQELDAALGKSKGATAVLFHATWCPFCRSFLPTFNATLNGQQGVAGLEAVIDDESNPLWTRFAIEVVPTVLVFENGAVKERIDGRPGVGLTSQDLGALLARR